MTKIKVAIFGGSFDPPTKGHIKLANLAVSTLSLDSLIFMPCYKHNLGKHPASYLDRLAMLSFTTKGSHNIFTSDYEIKKRSDGKTYNTMKFLVDKYPLVQFYYMIGMDCALEIEKWYNWQELITLVPFIVFHRPGYEPEVGNWFDYPPHIRLKYGVGAYSSTEVRQAAKNGNDAALEAFLDSKVAEYIKSHKLYK